MATQPQSLKVAILNEQGDPLAKVAGTVIGANEPQLKSTDDTGQCGFQNLPPGAFRLLTANEGKPATAGAGQQQATIQLATPQLSPAPKIGSEFTPNEGISGVEPPYTYVITFDPKEAVTTADPNQIFNNGKIAHTFKITDPKDLAGKTVTFEIAVSDKSQLKAKYDKGSFTV